MEVSSKHQLFVFVICIVSGIGCGVFFDVQRSLRKMTSAGKIRTLLEDILFGAVCIGGAIITGFLFNRGQMRYYQVMGLISGVLFYTAFLSRVTMKILTVIYGFSGKYVIKPIVLTVKAILSPLLKIYLVLKKTYLKMRLHLLKVLRHIKERKNRVKKRMKML